MKLKLNATGGQFFDWNQNKVNSCTWNSVICGNNNNVVQVLDVFFNHGFMYQSICNHN